MKIKNHFPEPLATQLVLYASQWDVYDIVVEMEFEPTYPMVPPRIRLVEPRFIPGAIANLGPGGVLESPLFRDGGEWSPISTIHNCVSEITRKLSEATIGKDESMVFFHPHFRSTYTHSEAVSQRLGFMNCYRVISVDDFGEMGGKVALPATALHEISSAQNPEFPLIFELKRTDISLPSDLSLDHSHSNYHTTDIMPSPSMQTSFETTGPESGTSNLASAHSSSQLKSTYAGVSTFDAIEGCILIPSWIRKNLGVEDGALITVRMVSLPKGDLVTLKPHDPEAFLSLEQPKEALESVLRSYYALQAGDTLVVAFDGVLHYFTVVHTSPTPTIDIKDTDLRLEIQMPADFDADKFVRPVTSELVPTEPLGQEPSSSASSTASLDGTSTCDNCKRSIPTVSIATHTAFCRRNNMICDMCEQVIRATDRQSHFEEVHKGVTCVCGEGMELRFLASHKQQECLHRLRACKFCKLKKKLVDLPEHEDYCGSRTEKCPKCQRFVSIKDLAPHTASNCAFPPQPETPSLFSKIKGFFG